MCEYFKNSRKASLLEACETQKGIGQMTGGKEAKFFLPSHLIMGAT